MINVHAISPQSGFIIMSLVGLSCWANGRGMQKGKNTKGRFDMENNILETLRLIWFGVILFSFGLAIISFFWGFVDLFSLVRFEGKIKRGIRIWSKPLPEGARKYLTPFSGSVVKTRKIWGLKGELVLFALKMEKWSFIIGVPIRALHGPMSGILIFQTMSQFCSFALRC